MQKENAKNSLARLRSELTASVEELDQEVHDVANALADEISEALGDEPTESRPGREQLEELAVKFETDHPRLSAIVLELADALGKLGI
jgi:hypothetical protein